MFSGESKNRHDLKY